MGIDDDAGALAAIFPLTVVLISQHGRHRADFTERYFPGGKQSVGYILMAFQIIVQKTGDAAVLLVFHQKRQGDFQQIAR